MTIRTHLTDLKEQREVHVRLLDLLETGRLPNDDAAGAERTDYLRQKLWLLDAVIASAEADADPSRDGPPPPPLASSYT